MISIAGRSKYGEAGWRLDDGPVVIDWMPGHNGQCPHGRRHRGEYQLYGFPGRHDHESVACTLAEATAVIEREWDEHVLAALAGAAERLLEQALDEVRNRADAIPAVGAALAVLRAEVGELPVAEAASLMADLAEPGLM